MVTATASQIKHSTTVSTLSYRYFIKVIKVPCKKTRTSKLFFNFLYAYWPESSFVSCNWVSNK